MFWRTDHVTDTSYISSAVYSRNRHVQGMHLLTHLGTTLLTCKVLLPTHTVLTHLPLVPHIYATENWVSIGSGNGLSPVGHQAITWTNADVLSTGSLWTNFSETRIKIQNFSFMKMPLKIPSANWRPLCPGGDEHDEGDECKEVLLKRH